MASLGGQKAALDQAGITPPNRAHDLVFDTSLAWGSIFKLITPTTKIIVTSLSNKIHLTKPIEKLSIAVDQTNKGR